MTWGLQGGPEVIINRPVLSEDLGGDLRLASWLDPPGDAASLSPGLLAATRLGSDRGWKSDSSADFLFHTGKSRDLPCPLSSVEMAAPELACDMRVQSPRTAAPFAAVHGGSPRQPAALSRMT